MSLSGKTAIVTGASSGIGRAIAEKLAAGGAQVWITARGQAALDDVRKRIEESGGRVHAEAFDVRDPVRLEGFVERAASDTGRLDVMVNNAGLSHPGPIASGEIEHWREMLEVNVLSLLVGCRAAIRAMRACKADGRIVNVSSIAAQNRESGVYGATKHAVNAITSSLRKELEGDTILVTSVMPGAIATNFARNFDPAFLAGIAKSAGVADFEPRKGEKLPDEVLEKIQPTLRRMLGRPEDVADAVLYVVTAPPEVNVAEIVVRPPRQLPL
jgi:NADP-dependent 3-hydroxy acid dehydrogenase YdfG